MTGEYEGFRLLAGRTAITMDGPHISLSERDETSPSQDECYALLTADEARELAAALLTAARCRDELDGVKPYDPTAGWCADNTAALQALFDLKLKSGEPVVVCYTPPPPS